MYGECSTIICILQGVKWEDTSKKEEKEDILPEKEDKKRTFFSLNVIQQKKKASNLHVNYHKFLIKKFLNTKIVFLNWSPCVPPQAWGTGT